MRQSLLLAELSAYFWLNCLDAMLIIIQNCIVASNLFAIFQSLCCQLSNHSNLHLKKCPHLKTSIFALRALIFAKGHKNNFLQFYLENKITKKNSVKHLATKG